MKGSEGARGGELFGFRLLSYVIFESSHAKGGAREGRGQKVGRRGGAGVSGDHGIKPRRIWMCDCDDSEPSSRSSPGCGGLRSTCLPLVCVLGIYGLEGGLLWPPESHIHGLRRLVSTDTRGAEWGGNIPPWLSFLEGTLPLVGGGDLRTRT